MHPSSNPRLVKEADALSDAGYAVEVIAPDYSSLWRTADEEYRDRAWRIVARPRFGPESPKTTRVLELSRRLLAGIATKNLGMMHPVIVRAAWHPVAPALVTCAKNINADLYIAHLVAALPAAALAAKKYGTRYAFDAEDFHLGDPPDAPTYELQRRLTRAMEEPYIRGCAYVTAASDGIGKAYADAYGIPAPKTVLNVFPKIQAPPAPVEKGSAEPGPSIYWYSQTIGGDRGLQSAIQAIGKTRIKPHLYLRGTPATGMKAKFLRIANAVGVADRVHFLQPELPHLMENLASQYDIGYCGELGHTKNRRIALTNKQFTYLLAGIPALMSDIPAHRAFSQKVEGAVQLFKVEDVDSLAQAIDAILCNPERLAAMRTRAWQLGQTRYNWDIEKKALLEQVTRVLG
jgi:glycosyltransferase involved in cell wall biosynthesis